MPRKGYRSITVREEIYDALWTQYNIQKDELLRQGITSFSGYVTKFLYESLERKEKK